ncbi:MAG: hypothetical protein AAFZ15_30740 [Bacteroidota bacterium]
MSQYLNYFNPYTSDRQGENSLTRAFMSLVRLCPVVRQGFYEMAREKVTEKHLKGEEYQLPPYHQLNSLSATVEIQQQSLPQNSKYLSVLISNHPVKLTEKIVPAERTAQYDGILSLDDITFFIENKPYDGLWQGQLCPAKKDFQQQSEEEYLLFDFAINLTWRQIIEYLNKVNDAGIFSEAEKGLISDFMLFVNEHFPDLNPYHHFHLCTSHNLVLRRIQKVLESISADNVQVNWHSAWAWCIPTDQFPYFGKLGMPLDFHSHEDWEFYVTVIMADTTHQARHFYHWQKLDFDKLLSFKERDKWLVHPLFHLGFMQNNLVYCKTPEGNFRKYLDYWKNNEIRQVQSNPGQPNVYTAIHAYMQDLHEKGIIIYDEKIKEEVRRQFAESKRQSANIRPGVFAGIYYHKDLAEKEDREGVLESNIKNNLVEFFQEVTGRLPDFIKV